MGEAQRSSGVWPSGGVPNSKPPDDPEYYKKLLHKVAGIAGVLGIAGATVSKFAYDAYRDDAKKGEIAAHEAILLRKEVDDLRRELHDNQDKTLHWQARLLELEANIRATGFQTILSPKRDVVRSEPSAVPALIMPPPMSEQRHTGKQTSKASQYVTGARDSYFSLANGDPYGTCALMSCNGRSYENERVNDEAKKPLPPGMTIAVPVDLAPLWGFDGCPVEPKPMACFRHTHVMRGRETITSQAGSVPGLPCAVRFCNGLSEDDSTRPMPGRKLIIPSPIRDSADWMCGRTRISGCPRQ